MALYRYITVSLTTLFGVSRLVFLICHISKTGSVLMKTEMGGNPRLVVYERTAFHHRAPVLRVEQLQIKDM